MIARISRLVRSTGAFLNGGERSDAIGGSSVLLRRGGRVCGAAGGFWCFRRRLFDRTCELTGH